ncbi:MAG: hypothetical protein KAJ22_00820 [Candidatus Izimaplasma sp.]|nr:hypothetical protein [Candidatus Izimaplasma bacterium]
MKEDALAYYSKPKDYLRFIEGLNIYNEWKILKGSMNTRGEAIRHKSYAIKLRKMFSDKKAFRREASISETVSWLDSFVMMTRTLDVLKRNNSREEYEKIEIYFEYIIKMSKKMRIDFIIRYETNLLLLEVRMVDNFTKLKGTWTKKKSELLIYKELMYNYIGSDIKILTYALITLHEYERREKMHKHIKYNNNQAEYLAEYIHKFMIKNR